MNYIEFEHIISTYKELNTGFTELYNMGFDFVDGKFKLETHTEKLMTYILESNFTEEGVDLIYWFTFEKEFGDNKEKKMLDSRGKEINDIRTLWSEVKQYLK